MLEFVDDDESVDSMRTEIAEMEKIVVLLLEAERLNSRHAQLSRSEVDVNALIGDLIDDFFSRDKHRIRAELPPEPVTASLDEARVSLLLKNLVANALRYSSEEDGPVVIAASADGDVITLTVSDRGPGLSKEQVAHLGEPFYRPDPSRARESGGTGLGLYLATLVATAHGGKLTLLDTPEEGATFEVKLPVA